MRSVIFISAAFLARAINPEMVNERYGIVVAVILIFAIADILEVPKKKS